MTSRSADKVVLAILSAAPTPSSIGPVTLSDHVVSEALVDLKTVSGLVTSPSLGDAPKALTFPEPSL